MAGTAYPAHGNPNKTNYEWINSGNCTTLPPPVNTTAAFSSVKWTVPERFKSICFFESPKCGAGAKYCSTTSENITNLATIEMDKKVKSYSIEFITYDEMIGI